MTALKEHLAALAAGIGDPCLGLPEDLFLFVSQLTPMVNVDLLIRNEQGQTLLTWRDDGYCRPGWHIPGGIVRYKESLAQRIEQVAVRELGASVSHVEVPLAIHEIVHPTRAVRGHFLSLLYACTLTSPLAASRRQRHALPQPGEWAWHDVCPDDLIPVHDIYRPFIGSDSGKG